MTCSNGCGGVKWEFPEGPEFSNWMVVGRCVCFFQASNVSCSAGSPTSMIFNPIPIIVVNNPSIKALFVGVVVPLRFPFMTLAFCHHQILEVGFMGFWCSRATAGKGRNRPDFNLGSPPSDRERNGVICIYIYTL